MTLKWQSLATQHFGCSSVSHGVFCLQKPSNQSLISSTIQFGNWNLPCHQKTLQLWPAPRISLYHIQPDYWLYRQSLATVLFITQILRCQQIVRVEALVPAVLLPLHLMTARSLRGRVQILPSNQDHNSQWNYTYVTETNENKQS